MHYLARKSKMQTNSMKCMICLIHLNFKVGFGQRLILKMHDTSPERLVVFRRCRPTSEMPVDTHVPRVFLRWWLWLTSPLTLSAGWVLVLPPHKAGWHFESSCLLEAETIVRGWVDNWHSAEWEDEEQLASCWRECLQSTWKREEKCENYVCACLCVYIRVCEREREGGRLGMFI